MNYFREGRTISISDYFSSLFNFGKEPTEEDIIKNMTILMEFPWFREIYEQKEFREIIETNKEIRYLIGKENIKSLKLYPKRQLKLRSKITNAIFFNINKSPGN